MTTWQYKTNVKECILTSEDAKGHTRWRTPDGDYKVGDEIPTQALEVEVEGASMTEAIIKLDEQLQKAEERIRGKVNATIVENFGDSIEFDEIEDFYKWLDSNRKLRHVILHDSEKHWEWGNRIRTMRGCVVEYSKSVPRNEAVLSSGEPIGVYFRKDTEEARVVCDKDADKGYIATYKGDHGIVIRIPTKGKSITRVKWVATNGVPGGKNEKVKW